MTLKTKSNNTWNKYDICYFSNGNVANSKAGRLGMGLKMGETVTMAIDMNLGSIQWKVGNQVRHEVTHVILKDNKSIWVPNIRLFPNDSVEIVE